MVWDKKFISVFLKENTCTSLSASSIFCILKIIKYYSSLCAQFLLNGLQQFFWTDFQLNIDHNLVSKFDDYTIIQKTASTVHVFFQKKIVSKLKYSRCLMHCRFPHNFMLLKTGYGLTQRHQLWRPLLLSSRNKTQDSEVKIYWSLKEISGRALGYYLMHTFSI